MTILKYIGCDDWNRTLYQDIKNKDSYCDTNLLPPYDENAYIHTISGGEPCCPVGKKYYQFLKRGPKMTKKEAQKQVNALYLQRIISKEASDHIIYQIIEKIEEAQE